MRKIYAETNFLEYFTQFFTADYPYAGGWKEDPRKVGPRMVGLYKEGPRKELGRVQVRDST